MSFLINPFIFAGGCSGDAINTTNLGAYYKFNNNANDSSGNGLNGTEFNSPTYSTGKYGDAISFNGTSQYVSVADNALIEGSGGTISVFGWVKITDYASDANPHIASKWDSGFSNGWRLVARSGDILVSLGATSTGRGSGVATGVWVHIGFTFNNNDLIIYQNGAQVGTTASIGAKTVTNSDAMNIGKRSTAGDGYVKGLVDEVNVWQRVLTPTEITTLYNSTCPLKS